VDNANYDPAMLLDLVANGAFEEEPFVLVDVGCGLGLDAAWRRFGPYLHAHGFDPQVDEIERLRTEEENPNVHYHAALVGFPGRVAPSGERGYFDPFDRTSAAVALARATSAGDTPFAETNDWRGQELTTAKTGLADFLRGEGVTSVDFVKTDTDGGDLEVLESFETMIEPARVLGFMVETPYTGSAADGVHTFHNVDRLMKRHGFLLAALSVSRYSRAALPAPFQYPMLAQTTWGQPMWGDLVYLRDGVHPDGVKFGALSPLKLLKLAALYEIFTLPDCAAELLLERRADLSPLVDVDRLLDLLTPPLGDERLGYREYVAAFAEDPSRFYPQVEPEQEEQEEPEPEPQPPAPSPTLAQRAKYAVARAVGRAAASDPG
jgi:FkbM family methyltransferase